MRCVGPFVVAAVVAVGCGGGGCGGGASGGGGAGGGTSGPEQLGNVFAPKRYQRMISVLPPLSNVTIVLDTSMPPQVLAEAAAGVAAWVKARETKFRFSLVVPGDGCGLAQRIAPFPASNDRDVETEVVAAAQAVQQALGQVQHTTPRTALGTLALAKRVDKRDHYVVMVTQAEDACASDPTVPINGALQEGVPLWLVAYRPEPGAEAYLEEIAVAGGLGLRCTTRSDAECGPDNTCAQPALYKCRRSYRRAETQAGLTDLLVAQIPIWNLPPWSCDVLFEEVKGRPGRAYLNGLELKSAQWSWDRHTLTLKGEACDKAQTSTTLEPMKVEVEVPFSVESL